MAKRIFIWVGHPKSDSLCNAIGNAYQAGAERTGAEVRRMNLSEMSFDLNFQGFGAAPHPLEPDLRIWQGTSPGQTTCCLCIPTGGAPCRPKPKQFLTAP